MPNEDYEALADAFEQHTNMTAVGRDVSPAEYAGEEHERTRQMLWLCFCAGVRHGQLVGRNSLDGRQRST